jgi:hypothetical protein
MYYISDHKKKAIDTIIPYLIEFPQIVKIIEQSADRYQAIEDVLWKIANNFKVDDARGVFLQALAHNEVTNIIYTDKADDAFTYGTDNPLYQAYGTGHYYSQSSYISGIKKDVTDEKTIRAVKAKIIQNNTNCSIEDFIECLKLYYNADKVKIYESHPLNISVMLEGKNLEISSSNNQEIIKNILPVCVSLKNLYINANQFDLFQYDKNSSYGDARYPVLVGNTVDTYTYISQSVTLDSKFKEYIILNDNLCEDSYICICGAFTELNSNATLFSSTEDGNSISLKIDENNNFVVVYNGTTYTTDIQASLNTRYTFVINNSDNKFKLWIFNKVQIYGKDLSQDTGFCKKQILGNSPNLQIDDFNTISAPIYINCENNNGEQSDFADFTYYAIMVGNTVEENNINVKYYVSCYGEKQILFNCNGNNNHLPIYTNNPLISNIMTTQSYYNYKDSHSNGKYIYFDGKSGVDYFISSNDIETEINEFKIKFDVCMPIQINDGNILTNFIYDSTSKIYFNEDGGLCIVLPLFDKNTEENETITLITENNTISADEYAKFEITYKDNNLIIFKNNNIILKYDLTNYTINNIPHILKVAYDKGLSSFYKGFVKNLSVNIIGVDDTISLDLPYKYTLQDTTKEYEYTNYGARFITTPQLISDTSNLDLYGNALIGTR